MSCIEWNGHKMAVTLDTSIIELPNGVHKHINIHKHKISWFSLVFHPLMAILSQYQTMKKFDTLFENIYLKVRVKTTSDILDGISS